MQKEILKCENLHKKIGKKEILKGISLELDEGDILGFIGPNGAGKTTTIKLILGLQSITSGKVFINDYDIERDFEKAIAKVGSIVENPDLYMYMSGYDNLKLIANLYKTVDKKRIDEVVNLVGLENRIHDKVSKYSLGMRQRLGVAQAILHKPTLLILDEPTNGLDPEGIKSMRELLVKLAKEEHMAILISSHNLAELESFCNKVCIIKNGVIIETSDIQDVKKEVSDGYFIFEVNDTKQAKLLLGNDSTIIDESKKMSVLVSNMLELSRLESGALKPNFEVFNVNRLIKNLVRKHTLDAQERELTLEFVENTEYSYIHADTFQMEQILTNLITNALKYTPPKEKIIIEIHEEDDKYRLSVVNTGTHIDDNEINKLFDKFYKIDKSRQRKSNSTGLGLSIVKNLLQLHNFEYSLKNIDEGVEFAIYMPIVSL